MNPIVREYSACACSDACHCADMAPRTESPRLAMIDPVDLARQCVAAQLALINRMGESIGVSAVLSGGTQAEKTALGRKVVLLAQYAKTGRVAEWADDAAGGAMDAQIEVMRLSRGQFRDMDVVHDAVDGRVEMATDGKVEARSLAALAGISPQQVRLLMRKSGRKAPMPAKSAAKWLRDRGAAV